MRGTQNAATGRRGFTMVELMVVIIIIAILAALLLPAIAAAVAAANNARVASEEQNLQTALADFKNKYGEYPPSRIILWNLTGGANAPYGASTTPISSATADLTVGDLNQRTVRAMRKYFPRAAAWFPTSGLVSTQFSSGGIVGPVVWGPNNPTILEGDECLVFFLGGIAQKAGGSGGFGVTGFNRDPSNPFIPNTTSRLAPLFDFAPQRLVDTDGDGFPSYIDPLSATGAPNAQRPYAYFSAYGNNGYDPNDVNQGDGSSSALVPEVDDALNLPFLRGFVVNFVTQNTTNNRVAISAPPNPYTTGDPMALATTVPWYNPQSFQLISAGRDGLWGLGGAYDPSSGNTRLPSYASDAGNIYNLSGGALSANTTNDGTSMRVRERDNITNFAGGRLD